MYWYLIMLSNAEREYLKNPNQYGHYPRILRTRIRKKIIEAIQDLALLAEAEINYKEWKPTYKDGNVVEEFDSISDPLAGEFNIQVSSIEKIKNDIKFVNHEKYDDMIVIFIPDHLTPSLKNKEVTCVTCDNTVFRKDAIDTGRGMMCDECYHKEHPRATGYVYDRFKQSQFKRKDTG